MSLVLINPSANIARTALTLDVPLTIVLQRGSRVEPFTSERMGEVFTLDLSDREELISFGDQVLRRVSRGPSSR